MPIKQGKDAQEDRKPPFFFLRSELVQFEPFPTVKTTMGDISNVPLLILINKPSVTGSSTIIQNVRKIERSS